MTGIVNLYVILVILALYETSVRSFLVNDDHCSVQPKVSTCETCSGTGKNDACRNVNNFAFGKYCYRETTYNASGVFFTKGVASDLLCRQKLHLSTESQPECKKSSPASGTVCFDCCFQSNCAKEKNYCNDYDIIPVEFMPYHPTVQATTHTTKPTTHTTKPTTHTTKPTTHTTKPTTHTTKPTTHTTKPTTHTTKPTTHSTTTTTTVAPSTEPPTVSTTSTPTGRVCQVCQEKNGKTCNNNDFQTCDVSQPYCMNTLITDTTGSIVLKKCAGEIECKWDYWIGTRSDKRCNTTSGFSNEIDLCHYCCQTDEGSPIPCNTEKVPTQLVSFAESTQTRKKCIVGDSVFGTYQEVCDSDKAYCLNTVQFSIGKLHPIAQVSKKCALEAECKGQWWFKTRYQPECFPQNFHNVTQSNILCHYCCISNDTDACNGAAIPNQLYNFLPPTTVPTPTKATTVPSTNAPTTIKSTTESTTTTTRPTSHTTTPSTISVTTATTDASTTMKYTTPAITEIPCTGLPTVICKDDPMVDCVQRNAQDGLCKLTNPLVVDHCAVTCGLCNEYCAKYTTTATTSTSTVATTTSLQEIPCKGTTAITCKDDALVNCVMHNLFSGLCQKNDPLVVDHCALTCGKCDEYCAKNAPAAKNTTIATTTTDTSAAATTATTTSIDTTTNSSQEIACRGTTATTCKDDPLMNCVVLNQFSGLCRKNDSLVTDHCAVTCGKCNEYCAKHAVTVITTFKSPSKMYTSTEDLTSTSQSTTTTTKTTTASLPTTTAAKATTGITTAAITAATTTSATITATLQVTPPATSINPTTTLAAPTTMSSSTSSNTLNKLTTFHSTSVTKDTSSSSTKSTNLTWVTVPTSKPQTTVKPLAFSCYVCSGPTFLCESLYRLQSCPSDKQFCMNRVVNNNDGSRTMTRSCVTEDECKQEWWQVSSSKNQCVGYDVSIITTLQFNCAYCCTTSGCNLKVIPSDLYIGSK